MRPRRIESIAGAGTAAHADPDDDVLVDRVAAGDERAFTELVGRWGARLRDYLARVVGEADAADDLLQDVLVATYRAAATRDRAQPLRVWLFCIARNAALSHLRRRSAQARLLSRLVDGPRMLLARFSRRADTEPAATLMAGEFEQAFAAALARLPEEFRTVFLLREREELSYEEIAAIVGAPAKTVSTRLARARERLRHELQAWSEMPARSASWNC